MAKSSTRWPLPKVLHVITSLDDGGAEGALFRLCKFEKQHQHVVVSLRDFGKYGPLLEEAGIAVYSLEMNNAWTIIRGAFRLFLLLRRERPSLIQTWLYHGDLIGGVIGKLAGIQHIVWGVRHGNLSSSKIKWGTLLTAKFCALLSHLIPSLIISCSHRAAATHINFGYAPDKLHVIPNGYDFSKFSPDEASGNRVSTELNLPSDRPIIGMVARYDVQKDHRNLIAALSVLKNRGIKCHCVLVGTNITISNFEIYKVLIDYGVLDMVTLCGRRDDISAIMNALDLHVLSSLGEAFPNVLAEAMACEIPCVTTDVGDADLIVGSTGWVAPPGNPLAFADCIEHAITELTNEQSWIKRKHNARMHIQKNFSIDRMIKSYSDAWDRQIEKLDC